MQLEEIGEKKLPLTVVMGVLAEDWTGMGNSILGIIHQKHGNVLFMKGFTLSYLERKLGIVILSFLIATPEEYGRFLKDKNNLLTALKDASQGTVGKTLMLEDETIKFDLYNQVIKTIKKMYRGPDINEIIGENGETLKFFSSRSREYLQERKLSDLAGLVIDNYRFQKQVREGRADKKIKIKNFVTLDERLTGITFVCWEENFSVESFLKTLDFIVPGHIIKHHKSFVSAQKILVYRIEIVDRQGLPLNPEAIRSIEISLERMISTAVDEKFSQIKSVGGYEHYARAIIPFLMAELKTTGISQVFMSVEKKTEFMMQLKLIIVVRLDRKNSLNQLIRLLENNPRHRDPVGHPAPPLPEADRGQHPEPEDHAGRLRLHRRHFPDHQEHPEKNVRPGAGFRRGAARQRHALADGGDRRGSRPQSPADQGDLLQFRRDLPPGDPAAHPGRDHEAGLLDHQGGQEGGPGPRDRQVQEHPPPAEERGDQDHLRHLLRRRKKDTEQVPEEPAEHRRLFHPHRVGTALLPDPDPQEGQPGALRSTRSPASKPTCWTGS